MSLIVQSLKSMGRGRGRGKGKKLTVSNQDDPGCGEEEKNPAHKRRGRPQKALKDEIDEEEEEEVVVDKLEKDENENGKKRKQNLPAKETAESVEETGNASIKTNGFRNNGSRRKSKPRRAAEAIVECK